MKKIAILTLNGYFNYGNRLQNFALQETLKSLGFEVETLKVEYNHNEELPIFERIKKLKDISMIEFFNRFYKKIKNATKKAEIAKNKNIRMELFLEFTRDYIVETEMSISKGNMPKNLMEQYDYFVVGSDQVWNPLFPEVSDIYFLTFAPKDKRISYAASFGISKIPDKNIENYKEWLKDIKYLSVREHDGANIVKDLTGREVPVLVDPTLLLNKEKWLMVSKKANNKPNRKYLLTYFLGGLSDYDRSRIERFADNKDLIILDFMDINSKETYKTGPSEFIDYINSCTVFFTDSFHGVVFSIILEKPFVIFENKGLKVSMFSRINTLLSIFDLEDRKAEKIDWDGEALEIDYSNTAKILKIEREKSTNYLKKALEN